MINTMISVVFLLIVMAAVYIAYCIRHQSREQNNATGSPDEKYGHASKCIWSLDREA